MENKTKLWVDLHRPTTLSDYVWRDDRQRKIVESWIADKDIPHILLSGSPGTGKSSLVQLLLRHLELEPGDTLYINASEETSVETVRNKVLNFASTMAWGNFKIVILEEFDAMTPNAQNSLKRIIEDYSNTCRFVLTTNYPNKINPAIFSRCQGFHMESLNDEQFLLRLAAILDEHEIEYDAETLVSYVSATLPDLRKAINVIQMNSKTGKLLPPDSDSVSKLDYMVLVTELFRKGQINQGRELIISEASHEDYIEIFRYLYRNLDYWGQTEEKQDDALLVIRDGMVKDTMVADREINLSATLVQLKQIYESKDDG